MRGPPRSAQQRLAAALRALDPNATGVISASAFLAALASLTSSAQPSALAVDNRFVIDALRRFGDQQQSVRYEELLRVVMSENGRLALLPARSDGDDRGDGDDAQQGAARYAPPSPSVSSYTSSRLERLDAAIRSREASQTPRRPASATPRSSASAARAASPVHGHAVEHEEAGNDDDNRSVLSRASVASRASRVSARSQRSRASRVSQQGASRRRSLVDGGEIMRAHQALAAAAAAARLPDGRLDETEAARIIGVSCPGLTQARVHELVQASVVSAPASARMASARPQSAGSGAGGRVVVALPRPSGTSATGGGGSAVRAVDVDALVRRLGALQMGSGAADESHDSDEDAGGVRMYDNGRRADTRGADATSDRASELSSVSLERKLQVAAQKGVLTRKKATPSRSLNDRPRTPVLDLGARLREKVFQHDNFDEIFTRFDVGGKGYLTREETGTMLRAFGFSPLSEDVDALFAFCDTQDAGHITVHDVRRFCLENDHLQVFCHARDEETRVLLYDKRGAFNDNMPLRSRKESRPNMIQNMARLGGLTVEPKFIDFFVSVCQTLKVKIFERRNLLRRAFDQEDAGGSGFITADEFRRVVCHFNSTYDPLVLTRVFDAIDTDGSGVISYHQLETFLLRNDQRPLPYEMTEEERKRKYVFMEHCVLFSDVRPPPRERAMHRPLSAVPLGSEMGGTLQRTLSGTFEARFARLARALGDLDVSHSGFVPRDEVERVLPRFDVDSRLARVRAVLNDCERDGLGVDYTRLAQRLQQLSGVAGIALAGADLGDSPDISTPFGVHRDIVEGRSRAAASVAAFYDRVLTALEREDSLGTGLISDAQFGAALKGLRLSSHDLTQMLQVPRNADRMIMYREFVQRELESGGTSIPQGLRSRAHRSSGDVVAWSDMSPATMSSKRLIEYRGKFVLNDSAPHGAVAGSAASPASARSAGPSERSSMIIGSVVSKPSVEYLRFSRANPLLQQAEVGTPRRTPGMRLPSDVDADFAYGVPTSQAGRVRALSASAQLRATARAAGGVPGSRLNESLRTHSTRAAELRSHEVRRRMLQLEIESAQPYGTPRRSARTGTPRDAISSSPVPRPPPQSAAGDAGAPGSPHSARRGRLLYPSTSTAGSGAPAAPSPPASPAPHVQSPLTGARPSIRRSVL